MRDLKTVCATAAATVLLALGVPDTTAHAQDHATRIPCVADRADQLNEAVAAVNAQPTARWTITLQAGCVYTLTRSYAGVNGLEAVKGNLRITSDGPDNAEITRSQAPATPNFRIMEVEAGGRLSLDRITISNGAAGNGAALFNNFGTLTLDHSTLAGSTAGLHLADARS